ncbi:Rid family hydrolase [Streptomyces sp. NP160]|uniref:Rid family hydrolase n=1 Tax=Streptomyces sp. NP160 TaxID=2586637 RepID=UPI00214B0EDC|nr:Rid family hydrolase [Streptomyces sp. NP160]
MPTQLRRCLDAVAQQLQPQGMSLADLVSVRVRTTDAHAVVASVREIASQLREAGAAPSISVLAVERLPAPGQLVEVDATATGVGRSSTEDELR